MVVDYEELLGRESSIERCRRMGRGRSYDPSIVDDGA